MGHPGLRPGGAEGAQTAAQESYPFHHIAIFDLGISAIDRSLSTPGGETLFGRYRDQLISPLAEGRIISAERKQTRTDRQSRSQRRRMSQPPSLGDCRAAPCHCLVRIAETE